MKKQKGGHYGFDELEAKYQRELQYLRLVPLTDFTLSDDEVRVGSALQNIFKYLEIYNNKNPKNCIGLFQSLFSMDFKTQFPDIDDDDFYQVSYNMQNIVNSPLFNTGGSKIRLPLNLSIFCVLSNFFVLTILIPNFS